jgi:hypothetical protein
MSTLITPWGDIQLYEMKNGTKPLKMDCVVKMDGKVVFRDAAGKLYSPSVRDRLCYPISNWGWTPGVLAGLVKLGAITAKQVTEYKDAAAKSANTSQARYDLQALDKLAKYYGIKISVRERAKLVKAAGLSEGVAALVDMEAL